MCVAIPIVLAVVSVALTIASTVSSAVIADRQADQQDRLAKAQYNFETQQAQAKANELAEQSALERQKMAEEAARARGIAKTAGLGAPSLRSFLLDVSRKEGRANSILERNLELVAANRQAEVQGSLLSLAGKQLDISANRPSWAVVGLQIGSRTAGAAYDYKTGPGADPTPADLSIKGNRTNIA